MNNSRGGITTKLVAAPAMLLLAGLVLSACGGGSSASSSAATKALVSKALRNASVAGWVHETVKESGPGHLQTSDDEIGASSGRETIVSDGAHASELLVNGKAYIKGDRKAILDFFQFPTKKPQTLENRWIGIGPKDPGFASVSSTLSLASDFQQITFTGAVTKGAVITLNGQKVVPITGNIKNTTPLAVTLYLTVSGELLPVELHVTSGSIQSVVVWDKWGKGVSIVAPSSSIPIANILG